MSKPDQEKTEIVPHREQPEIAPQPSPQVLPEIQTTEIQPTQPEHEVESHPLPEVSPEVAPPEIGEAKGSYSGEFDFLISSSLKGSA